MNGIQTSIESPSRESLLGGVERIIAVASGKGGVGKSTVAVNLAVSLAMRGTQVGLLDADIYGPSLPLMMGVSRRPSSDPQTHLLQPLVRHGLKCMSMGLLSDENTPVIWRGPMVHKMVTALMQQVDWGELDFRLPGHRYECDRCDVSLTNAAVRLLLDNQQLLMAVRATNGYDHPPADRKLLNERQGHVIGSGGHKDRIKWCVFRPASVSIPDLNRDVFVT